MTNDREYQALPKYLFETDFTLKTVIFSKPSYVVTVRRVARDRFFYRWSRCCFGDSGAQTAPLPPLCHCGLRVITDCVNISYLLLLCYIRCFTLMILWPGGTKVNNNKKSMDSNQLRWRRRCNHQMSGFLMDVQSARTVPHSATRRHHGWRTFRLDFSSADNIPGTLIVLIYYM